MTVQLNATRKVQNTFRLPCDAVLTRYIFCDPVSVCQSVCMTVRRPQVGIQSKRLNMCYFNFNVRLKADMSRHCNVAVK